MQFNLSPEEIEQAAALLAKLDRGYLPQLLFNQFTRLSVTPTLVLVALRLSAANEPEVLLVQREANDPVWPSFWHLPGTLLRTKDVEGDFTSQFQRIYHDEIGDITLKQEPILNQNAFTETRRGREITQVYYAVIDEVRANKGAFFPVKDLPEPIIEHEPEYIQAACRAAFDAGLL